MCSQRQQRMYRLQKQASNGIWQIVWREWRSKGRHSARRSTGTRDRKEAEVFLQQFIAEKNGEESVAQPVSDYQSYGLSFRSGSPVTIREVLDLHWNKHVNLYPAESTRVTTKYNMKALNRLLGDNFVDELEHEFIINYGERRAIENGGEISSLTVNRELAVLSSALHTAKRYKLISGWNEFDKFEELYDMPTFITPEETWNLFLCCGQRHLRTFVMLAAATGARTEALLQLRWSQLDFKNHNIDLNIKGGRVSSKGRPIVKVADLPIWEALEKVRELQLNEVDKWGYGGEFVIEYRGRPVKSVSKGFSNAAKRAGLENVCPKTLRHSHASWLVQNGLSLLKVSKRLGHRSTRMVEDHYGHLGEEYQMEAANIVAGLLSGNEKRPQNGPTDKKDASEGAEKKEPEKTKSQGFPWPLGMVEPIRIELTTSTMPL